MDSRPIGMFDSGSGGLTVLKEYKEQLPSEDILYFGDTARIPYGSKSKETIIKFSKQIVNFLIKQNVKMIVIACGTASAHAYETLAKEYTIPIRTIITPTCKAIGTKNIGVIATHGTIKSQAWENNIHKYHPDAQITSIACPLFVPIVEEGWANTTIAKQIVHEYLKGFQNTTIESLILGCTHYPMLTPLLKQEMGESVEIINIGKYSALDTKDFLFQHNLYHPARKIANYQFYSSDDAASFCELAKVFLDISIPHVQKIEIENYNT